MLILVLAVMLFLSLHSHRFLTAPNLSSIFVSISIEGVIVIGMAYLFILGEVDLSVGSTMALSAVLAIAGEQYGIAAGVIAGLACGLAVGLLNGLLVTKGGLDSIPATLGVMVALRGVTFAVTKSETMKGVNDDLMIIANSDVWGVPLSVALFLALCLVFEFILRRTQYGRSLYAVGGNITASRLYGIRVDAVRVGAFCITGGLAGLAGVLLAARLNVASGRIGLNTPLLVITAVLLGGVSLSGGKGSVFKAFQGILLIGILNNAMVLLRVSPFLQEVVRGLLLIVLVVVDSIQRKRARFYVGREKDGEPLTSRPEDTDPRFAS